MDLLLELAVQDNCRRCIYLSAVLHLRGHILPTFGEMQWAALSQCRGLLHCQVKLHFSPLLFLNYVSDLKFLHLCVMYTHIFFLLSNLSLSLVFLRPTEKKIFTLFVVVTSFVCIFLTLCEVIYLCGKRFRECCTGRHHPERENTFMMTRTPLTERGNSPCNKHDPDKDEMAHKVNGSTITESSAPAYSVAVSWGAYIYHVNEFDLWGGNRLPLVCFCTVIWRPGEALVKCVNDLKKSLFSKVLSSFPNQLHHCCIYSSITVCHMILFCVTSFATK